jgi:plasmid stability protein
MNRTSIYLESDTLKALKLLAATSGTSVADKVREAIDMMLAAQVGNVDWHGEINAILARTQAKALPDLSDEQIVETVRQARQARRSTTRA